MKSNEQSPVDEYFRQHEAEIPVPFDDRHWSQLAAMLDAAETPGVPGGTGKVAAPRKNRFRGGKGWWASGIWILAVMTAFWIIWQTTGNNAAENGRVFPAQPETSVGSPAGSPGEIPQKAGNDGLSQQEKKPAAKSDESQSGYNDPAPGTENIMIDPIDSAGMRGIPSGDAPVMPADSVPVETKPVKKKKHLFW
jgi:hypothetical protein